MADFIAVCLNYFLKKGFLSTLKDIRPEICAFLHIFLDRAG